MGACEPGAIGRPCPPVPQATPVLEHGPSKVPVSLDRVRTETDFRRAAMKDTKWYPTMTHDNHLT
jgi:hypothetical protein